ncbi:MAG: Wzz/FepE/Etk N-terminal domain-containing protein [Oscillospiraceae bacterium]|nr:Wzz/FepE/Etk N-terminal domain-containing protein [Oscillospiraceae bacterium]
MNIKKYLKILYKKSWLVILIPLFAVVTTCLSCKFVMKPVYESSESICIISRSGSVSPYEGGYDSVMVDQQLLKDYSELVKSNYVTDTVLNTLSITDITREDLKKRVYVELKNEIRILVIKVQDKDPYMARALTETYGQVIVDQAVFWMNSDSLSVIDHAEIPEKAIKPDFPLYTLIAAIVGLLASVGIIFFMEYLDDTVKTVDEVEKCMGTAVLGTIPDFEIISWRDKFEK